MSLSFKRLTGPQLLQALYKGTSPLGMGFLHDQPNGLSDDDAELVWAAAREHMHGGTMYFDYVAGRPLKVMVNPEAETIDRTDLYDRDAGVGACEAAVTEALATINQQVSTNPNGATQ